MATGQLGTGGLIIQGGGTAGTPTTLEAKAATLVGTLVAGTIVEGISVEPGGTPSIEEQRTSSGAFHTDLVFENRQDEATVTLVGTESGLSAGVMAGTGATSYEIKKVSAKYGKAAVKTEVSVKKVVFS